MALACLILNSKFEILNSFRIIGMSVPIFFALYCVEAGLFFLIVPWTRMWTLNPLLHSSATLSMFAGNPFIRGFVSGFGVVHLLIAANDLIRITRARRAARGGGVS
jgi:hypothetical protein